MRGFLVVGSVVAILLASAAVLADEPAAEPAKADTVGVVVSVAPLPCPVCIMMGEKGIKQDVYKVCGISAGMALQFKMVLGAELSRDDAVCLLAMKDKLALTKEQTEKLQTALGSARQAAAELLAAKQRDEVWGEIPGNQLSVCEIHGQMHGSLRPNMEDPDVWTPCTLCAAIGASGVDRDKASAAGMTPEMVKQAEMLLAAGLSREDGQCLLALKDQFELAPEQIEKLVQVIADGRKAAVAALTPEQQKTLAELPESQTSILAIHGKLHVVEAKPAPSAEEKPKVEEPAKPAEEKPATEKPEEAKPAAEKPAEEPAEKK